MSDKSKTITALNYNNQQLNALLNRIYEVDEGLLNKKIDNESWSVIQIFNHLYETEDLSLNYLKYKEKMEYKFSKITFKSLFKYRLLMFAYGLPIKFKAPTVLSQPSNELSFNEVQDKFASLRQKYLAFIERQDEEFFNLATCKHPVTGRIKMIQMLKFFRTHTVHHEKQMLRTLIKLSK